ncbi:HNH endonuclease [Caulobacter segnis]|uniref:HNH endonuclease n=1 Tax=Caulobacter segnis TaxID=88688 RepID=A0A2W5VH29_9CAUL|nr:HNH endonuclease [Caulobacter segnis]PZR37213.1 MAG: HNH endonuclease [Caulobacter segnis]
MRGKRIVYTPAELAWLEANCTLPFADYLAGFQQAFTRPDVSADNLHALRKRKGWKTGRSGRFEKGAIPANKGKPCPSGVGGRHPNAVRTQFKKGDRTGRAALLYKPIGTERRHPDGYLERKINDDLPLQARWRAVHIINWEALNGPVPAGHCLKSVDGDKTNTDPSNWMLVERAIMPTLNGGPHKKRPGFDEAPADLRPALLNLAKVKVKAAALRRKAAK